MWEAEGLRNNPHPQVGDPGVSFPTAGSVWPGDGGRCWHFMARLQPQKYLRREGAWAGSRSVSHQGLLADQHESGLGQT